MLEGIKFIKTSGECERPVWFSLQTSDLGDRVQSLLKNRNLLFVLENLSFQMLLICSHWRSHFQIFIFTSQSPEEQYILTNYSCISV